MKKILIVLVSFIFVISCKENNPVSPTKGLELIIDVDSYGISIEDILLENGYFYILDRESRKWFNTNGELIERINIPDYNGGLFNRKIKKVRNGFNHLVIENDTISGSKVLFDQYSNGFNNEDVLESDTVRLKDNNHYFTSDVGLIDNTAFKNNCNGGFIIRVNKEFVDLESIRLYSSNQGREFKNIISFRNNDYYDIFLDYDYTPETIKLFAYKDKFLLKGHNLYLINQDGSYRSILPDKVKGRYEIFEYDNKLFINSCTNYKSTLYYTNDLVNFEVINLDYLFLYAGQIEDILIGRTKTERYEPIEISAIDLESKKYYILNANNIAMSYYLCTYFFTIYSFSHIKVTEYMDYAYFIDDSHVYKIKTEDITFEEE